MIMAFEGTEYPTVEDVTGPSEDDLHFYVTEFLPEDMDAERPADGIFVGPGPDDDLIVPVFDLLGEPWTGHAE